MTKMLFLTLTIHQYIIKKKYKKKQLQTPMKGLSNPGITHMKVLGQLNNPNGITIYSFRQSKRHY